MLQAYVDMMDRIEAENIITMARAFLLAQGGPEAWARAIDRTLPPAAADETFFRYEGKPVRLPELEAALSERWGAGFSVEAL